jgi:3-hydroxyacyl-[acyl-carrier-protein] dehydratase
MLDRERIEEILPHREPFLLLDEVTELVPGQRVVARRLVRPDEYYFQGHFPGRPIMPGVLQIEAMAQAGAVAALSMPEHQGRLVLFAGIDHVRFKRLVVPGDELTLAVEMVRMRRNIGKAEGTASVGDELAASATLTFAIAEREG